MSKSLKISSATSVLANVVHFALGLVLTPFIIKHLGEEYFGLWVFLNVFLSLEGMMLLGTTQSLNRFLPMYLGKKEFKELSNTLYSHLLFYLFWGICIVTILYSVQGVVSEYFKIPASMLSDFQFAYPYLLGTLILNFISQVFSALIRTSESYVEFNIVSTLTSLIRFGLIILFISHGFEALVYAIFFSTIFKLICLIITSKITWKFQLEKFNTPLVKLTLKSSLIFGTGSLLMYASDLLRHQIDSFLILRFLDLNALSQYKIGTTLLTSINIINISLFGVLLTRFSFNVGEKSEVETRELIKKSFFVSATLGSFFILGLIATAENFLHIWLPRFDQSSLEIIYLLALPQLIMIIQYPTINFMYAVNKHHLLSYITFGEALLNVIISYYLITNIGLIGVIIGTGIGYIVSKGVIMPILVNKIAKLSYLDQIKVILPSLIIAGCVWGLYSVFFAISTTTVFAFSIKFIFIVTAYGILFNLYFMTFPSQYSEMFMLKNWIRRNH